MNESHAILITIGTMMIQDKSWTDYQISSRKYWAAAATMHLMQAEVKLRAIFYQ